MRLQVKRRTNRKGKPPGDPKVDILYPERPGQVWSVDFIFDALASGATLKMLTVGDDFTRECLCIAVATSFPSRRVIAALDRVIQDHAAPQYLKSDNGSQFIAHVLQVWLAGHESKSHFIAPGSPWQNGGYPLCGWGEFSQSFPRRVSLDDAVCQCVRGAGFV